MRRLRLSEKMKSLEPRRAEWEKQILAAYERRRSELARAAAGRGEIRQWRDTHHL